MKRTLMPVAAVTAIFLFSPCALLTAQAAPQSAKEKKHVAKESTVEREIRELRQQLQAQQAQIDALQAQLAAKTSQNATAQQAAADAQVKANAAAASAQQAVGTASDVSAKTATLTQKVSAVETAQSGLQQTVVANQKQLEEAVESPLALRYKDVAITPIAYFALEGVWRQHSTNSDINTPFNNIPFPNAAEGHVSELNLSARQSRLAAKLEANTGSTKLTGYVETDFLGSGTTSNNNQSNSYVLRLRQFWARAEMQSGLGISGGQMWSLVTEDAKGTENRTERTPETIDPQYMIGFSWTRQPALRLSQRWGDLSSTTFTAALSVEQAQITSFTVNGTAPVNYFFSGGGTNGGLYNAAASASGLYLTTYANNVAPDVVLKGALDLPHAHFELGGLARWLCDFYNPVSVVGGAYAYNTTQQLSNTKLAGGIFGSVRVSPVRFAEVGVQAMAGDGVGRYGSSQLADATLRPDETLEPVRNYHGLVSIETHPASKWDLNFYYGGEYAQRTVYANGLGGQMGYGIYTNNNSSCYNLPVANSTTLGNGNGGTAGPSACGAPTRYIQEAMGGLTYRAIDSSRYGRLQYQLTYSYIQRNLWSGISSATTPAGPRATEPMIHIGMRYYIP